MANDTQDILNFEKELENIKNKADVTAKAIGENFKSGIDMASTALKAFDGNSNGFLNTLGNIVDKISVTKESLSGMSSSLAKGFTIVGTAVGIGASLITYAIGEIQKAEENRKKAFNEGVESIRTYSNNLHILETNISILDDEKSTVDQVRLSREILADTFDDLVLGYSREGRAILANDEALQNYLKTQQQSMELSWKKTTANYGGDDDLKKIKENISLVEKFLASDYNSPSWISDFHEVGREIGRMDWVWELPLAEKDKIEVLKEVNQAYVDLQEKQFEYKQDATENYASLIKQNLSYNDGLTGIQKGWLDLDNAQEIAANSILRDNMPDIIATIEGATDNTITWQEVMQKIANTVSDSSQLEEYLSQFNIIGEETEQKARLDKILTEQYGEEKASVEDLTTAYKMLADKQSLSDEQLHKLAITYPEINEYIKETGDFSLDSGLKIAEAMARLDVSPQIDSLNNLSSAYELLSSGQELSSEQLNTLIDQYPEIARFIIENGELTSQNCGILMEEYEIKKQNLIATLQNNQSEAQSQADKTRSIIKSIQSEIDARRALIESQGATYLASDVYQLNAEMGKQKKILEEQEKAAAKAAAALQRLENPPKVSGGNNRTSSAPKKTTPTRNEALQKELKQLEQKKKMDKLTSEEELKQLQRMQKKYKMNADEKADMEYRIYALKKKIREDEEKANSEKLKDEYKRIENKKSLDELSAKEELQWLKKIQKTFKMNKEEQMELTIKLYHLEQQIRDDSIESLNTIGDAVTEALKNKYEEQRKLEEKLIDDSIKSWEEWEEKTVAAIQGEIDALDELAESQEKEEQRAEYERKRQALTLQLSYERDDYNRKQLQKELNRLDEEERKRQEALAREERKKELEAEIEAAQKKAEEQRDALEKEKDKIGETYDELLKDANLRAEAERAIMEQSQKQIVEMIKSYAPDYDLAGQSIGEKLVDGFMKKVGDIEKYFDSIQDKITSYQQDMANVATKAADDFWKGRAEYEKKITAEAAKVQAESGGMTGVIADIRDYLSGEKKPQGFGQYSLEVNFNQPVESPVEMRRQLEKAMQELARKVGG